MTAYLGPAGNLVAFKCPSDEQISQADNLSLEWTIGGVQKAQRGALAPRAWQLSLGTATPEQVRGLLGLVQGLYGPPPWTYVGPWAQVSNLFSRAASMSLPGSWSGAGTAGPAVTLDDGSTPSYSVLNAGGEFFDIPSAPVVPGVPVTASIWAAGQASFDTRLVFRDDAGGWLASTLVTHQASAGSPLRRGSVTAVPPAGSVNAFLRVYGALRATMPALTWTPDAAPWAPGEGAPKVLVRGLDRAVQLAVQDTPFLRRMSLSFTIEEVGNA